MNLEQIRTIQETIGAEPDGFWGPISTKACRNYLRARMPVSHPFPTSRQVTAFYGRHGEPNGSYSPPTVKIDLPFDIYYGDRPVNILRPHEKCAESLLHAFELLASRFPTEYARRTAGILTYDGLYNPRPMRGGTAWSMHSWAIAIDLCAAKNGNTVHWPTGASMPLAVMECFAEAGWTPAGAFWSRDAMHFEAVCPF